MKMQNDKLIKMFEGLHDGDKDKPLLQPQMCPSGIWTVGWGYALVNKKTGKWLKGASDMQLVVEQYPELLNIDAKKADELFVSVLEKYERIVNSKIKIRLKQHEFDALVSHTYNTGGSDTLFKLVNARSDVESWWTTKYITSDGKVLQGLVRRRKTEYNYFKTGK